MSTDPLPAESTASARSGQAERAVPTARLVVAAALLDGAGRLLAARRTEPPRLAGGWELPGGKVEAGEHPMHALHRELREELGVRIEVLDPVPGPLAVLAPDDSPEAAPAMSLDGLVDANGHLRTWPLALTPPGPQEDPRPLVMLVWTARVVAGEPRALEGHALLRWLGQDDVFSVPWLPADLPILRALEPLIEARS